MSVGEIPIFLRSYSFRLTVASATVGCYGRALWPRDRHNRTGVQAYYLMEGLAPNVMLLCLSLWLPFTVNCCTSAGSADALCCYTDGAYCEPYYLKMLQKLSCSRWNWSDCNARIMCIVLSVTVRPHGALAVMRCCMLCFAFPSTSCIDGKVRHHWFGCVNVTLVINYLLMPKVSEVSSQQQSAAASSTHTPSAIARD